MKYKALGFICYSLKNFDKDADCFINLLEKICDFYPTYKFTIMRRSYLWDPPSLGQKFNKKNLAKVFDDVRQGKRIIVSFHQLGKFLIDFSMSYNLFFNAYGSDINSIEFGINTEAFENKNSTRCQDEFIELFKTSYITFKSCYGIMSLRDDVVNLMTWFHGGIAIQQGIEHVEQQFDYDLVRGRSWGVGKFNVLLNRIRGVYFGNIINPRSVEMVGGLDHVLTNCPAPIVKKLDDGSVYIQTMSTLPTCKAELALNIQSTKKFLDPIKPDNDIDINQVYVNYWKERGLELR